MARVFVLNKSAHDFSSAESFGELIFVTDGHYNIFNTGQLIQFLANFFSDFDSQEDFLVMSGSPFVASLAFTYLINNVNSVKLLLFDAKQRIYIPRTLTFTQFKKGDK